MPEQNQTPDLEERLRQLAEKAKQVDGRSEKADAACEPIKRTTLPDYIYEKPPSFKEMYELTSVGTIYLEHTFTNVETQVDEIAQPGGVWADINEKVHIDVLLLKFRDLARKSAAEKNADLVYVNEQALKIEGGITSQQVVNFRGDFHYTVSGTAEFYRLKAK